MNRTMDDPEDSVSSMSSSAEEEDALSTQSNIALMFELQEKEMAQQRARKRVAGVLLSVVVVLLGIAGYLFWPYLAPTKTTDTPAPTTATVTAKQVAEQVVGNYTFRKIEVSGPAYKALTVGLYDFDANHFLSGKEDVDNPAQLRSLLSERRAEMKDSLILIFAGASFEGEPDENRNLCRRRGCYVGKMAIEASGVSAINIWVVAAGEYKAQDITGANEETKEDDVKKSPNGERVLKAQRRLILLTIPAGSATPATPENQRSAVGQIVEALRRGGNLLPTSYDHGQSDPTPLAEMNCKALTKKSTGGIE